MVARPTSLALPLLLLAQGAAPATPPDGDADRSEWTTPSGPQCISVTRIRGHDVSDAGELDVRLDASRRVRVEFDRPCRSLDDRRQISYRSTGSRLCRGDVVRVVDSFGADGFPIEQCAIAGFREIPREDDSAG